MFNKIKNWLKPDENYQVGRPKIAEKSLKKSVKIEIALAFVLCATLVLSGTSLLTGKSPLELIGVGNQIKFSGAITQLDDRFVVEKSINSSICYRIYMPKNAGKNWRIHVYYKKSTDSSFSKILYSYQYSVDTFKDICFKKMATNNETFRILVKWTTGQNDIVVKSPSSSEWRPIGWSYKSDIGWSYKDFAVDWSLQKVTTAPTTKVTTTQPAETTTKATTTQPVETTIKASTAMPSVLIKPIKTSGVVIVSKGNIVKIETIFKTNSDRKYYRKWYVYNGSSGKAYSECALVQNKVVTTSLTVTSNNKKGVWKIYSDSTCKKEVKAYSTNIYSYTAKTGLISGKMEVGAIGYTGKMTVYAWNCSAAACKPGLDGCGHSLKNGKIFFDMKKQDTTSTNTGLRVIATSNKKIPKGTILKLYVGEKLSSNQLKALSKQLQASIDENGIMRAIVQDSGVSGYAVDLAINSERNLEGWPNLNNVKFVVEKVGKGCLYKLK